MGVLLLFESKRMLLQREDFAAALKVLRKVARDHPGFFRDRAAVLGAADLPAALEASELAGSFDRHGDLVGLRYGGDKLPAGAPEDFPLPLIVAWKKLLRDALFDHHLEGAVLVKRTTVDRGAVRSQDVPRVRRRFVPLDPVPRVPLGEVVTVRFRYVSDVEGDAIWIAVKASDALEPIAVALSSPHMLPGDEVTLTARALPGRAFYPADEIHAPLYGDGDGVTVRGHAALVLGVPEDLDRAHDVVAAEHDVGVGIYLPAKTHSAALEDVRRYAGRFANERGAEFLGRVATAGDIGAALREAGFSPTIGGGGDLTALAYAAGGMPGHARFVVGLLRSFAGLTSARSARVRLAFASTPEWWMTLLFDPRSLRRAYEPRTLQA